MTERARMIMELPSLCSPVSDMAMPEVDSTLICETAGHTSHGDKEVLSRCLVTGAR